MRPILPWNRHKEMTKKLEEEEAKTAELDEEVVRPLQRKRHQIEHNGYARLAAEGLGIIRRGE